MSRVEILDDNGNPIPREEYERRQSTHHQSGKGGKSYEIPDRVMDNIVKRSDKYWSELLGRKIHFDMSKIDVAYSTVSDTALFRNEFLKGYFLRPPVVVDAYAGIGMDTISFLFNLYYRNEKSVKKIYTVENYDSDENKGRNNRLINNVQRFINVMDEKLADEARANGRASLSPGDFLASRIEFHLNGTEAFFKKCKNFKVDPVTEIDLLYIDPPWTLPNPYTNSGENGEATPDELFQFIYDSIFEHLIRQKIEVRVACIKTRFPWENVAPLLDLLEENIPDKKKRYSHAVTVECTPFKGTYYFHVIKTAEAEYGKWEQSDLYQWAYATRNIMNGDRVHHRAVQYTEDGEREVAVMDPKKKHVWEARLDPQRQPPRRYSPGQDRGVESDVAAILKAMHERLQRLEG